MRDTEGLKNQVTLEEFERVAEILSGSRNEKIELEEGLTISFEKNGKIIFRRNPLFELSENVRITAMLYTIIAKINLRLEDSDKIEKNGEINTLKALITTILVVKKQYSLRKVKQIYMKIYEGLFKDLRFKSNLISHEFETFKYLNFICFFLELFQFEKNKISNISPDLIIKINGKKEFLEIDIKYASVSCNYKKDWRETVMTIECEEVKEYEDSENESYSVQCTHDHRSDEKFLSLSHNEVEYECFNIQTLYVYRSERYIEILSGEDMCLYIEIMEKISSEVKKHLIPKIRPDMVKGIQKTDETKNDM